MVRTTNSEGGEMEGWVVLAPPHHISIQDSIQDVVCLYRTVSGEYAEVVHLVDVLV